MYSWKVCNASARYQILKKGTIFFLNLFIYTILISIILDEYIIERQAHSQWELTNISPYIIHDKI